MSDVPRSARKVLVLYTHTLLCLFAAVHGQSTSAGDPAPASQPEPPLASSQNCTGSDVDTRVCSFRNVVFDRLTRTLIYTTSSPSAVPLMARRCNPNYIRLGPDPPGKSGFALCVTFMTAPLPRGAAVREEPAPTYLLAPYHGKAFGHLLRDNFNIVAENLRRLGLERRPHQLLITEAPSTTMLKYAPLIATRVAQWDAHLGALGTQRYVLFRDLVAGYGARKLMSDRVKPHMCASAPFLAQRGIALRLAGLPEALLERLPRVRVLLLDKTRDDKRRILNVPALLAAFRARFPAVEFAADTLRQLSPAEQLRYLSTVSVLVSTVGSASFRLIYLPTNARVVLITAPNGASGARCPEYVECWQYVPHFRFFLYNRTRPEETVVRFIRWPKAKVRNTLMELWDADVAPDPAGLTAVVAEALEDALAARALSQQRE